MNINEKHFQTPFIFENQYPFAQSEQSKAWAKAGRCIICGGVPFDPKVKNPRCIGCRGKSIYQKLAEARKMERRRKDAERKRSERNDAVYKEAILERERAKYKKGKTK